MTIINSVDNTRVESDNLYSLALVERELIIASVDWVDLFTYTAYLSRVSGIRVDDDSEFSFSTLMPILSMQLRRLAYGGMLPCKCVIYDPSMYAVRGGMDLWLNVIGSGLT